MSSFKRTAAAWVLRQAARRAAESATRRRQAWANPGPTGTGTNGGWAGGSWTGAQPSGTGTTGADSRQAEGQPGWARSTGPRSSAMPMRVEDIVRRAWPLLDTPANRERAARFVERMRTVANSPR
jgi:hypothetical protein